jgi:hypothetical protein
LSQRAIKFQDAAILANSPSKLSLFLRYQTTNDRAFHKCLAELSKLNSAKDADARRYRAQELACPLGGVLDAAPVLRDFPIEDRAEFESQNQAPPEEFESQIPQATESAEASPVSLETKTEPQRGSAVVTELRGIPGDDFPISNRALLDLVRRKSWMSVSNYLRKAQPSDAQLRRLISCDFAALARVECAL